jgi:succinate dehydrogenase / fumarate reductase, membrane anchor subunit
MMMPSDMRSPLARARGLGSAKEGVAHWWAQRVTSVALLPLGLWLAFNLVALSGAGHAAVSAWLAAPVTTLLLLATLAAAAYHAELGLRVVIEDYVYGEAVKLAAILATRGLIILLFAAGALAALQFAFGS